MISEEPLLEQDVVVAFHKAEEVLKRYERLTLKPLLPAINQLRYAGEHLSLSIRLDGNFRIEALRKAKSHCDRAYYDAIECVIVEILEAFHRLRNGGYTVSELLEAWPKYEEVKPVLLEGQSRLESLGALKSLSKESREELQIFLDRLIGVYFELCANIDKIDEMRKRAYEARESDKAKELDQIAHVNAQREDRRYWSNMAVSVVGVLLSLLGIVLTLRSMLA